MELSPPSLGHCYGYFHDDSFSDPVNSPRMLRAAGPMRPIALAPENIQPEGGFAAQLSNAPVSNGHDEKIIYAVRHGNTPHNEDSETWGKPVAWRYLSGLKKNFDPPITPEGISNATTAAQYLSEMVHSQSAPRPLVVYSSPLRRCIETAMHLIKHAGLHHPTPDRPLPPVLLQVREGLREWMGYGHGHQTDKKGSKAEIRALVEQLKVELGVDVNYWLDVPEQEDFHDEVYIDVDKRVRDILDDIFNNPTSGGCVMFVLHSRCHKSLLRLLGYPPAAVDEFEMANCAILPYRITRCKLNDWELAAMTAQEARQRQQDQLEAEASKNARLCQAVKDVRSWDSDPNSRHLLDNLWATLQLYADQHDPAAELAMRTLADDLNPS